MLDRHIKLKVERRVVTIMDIVVEFEAKRILDDVLDRIKVAFDG